MATIEQMKALMRAHLENDSDKFKTIALQIAAHEAKIGHISSAKEIKDIILNPKYNKSKIIKLGNKFDFLEQRYSDATLLDLVLSEDLDNKIKRVLKEYRKVDVLRKNGLKNRSKLLFAGIPGTGKTMTASIIANELGMPLFVIRIDRLITKYMGETSVKLRQVFDQIQEIKGVYLFDEFDAIGSDRSFDNDVGEMRRILNSFLQNLEEDNSYSIIAAATNNPNLLDSALFRRFDDVLEYKYPDLLQIEKLFDMKLKGNALPEVFSEHVYLKAKGLSHADIARAFEDAVKYSILEESDITQEVIISYLQDRRDFYKYKEA